jgi:hypothetical protein
MRRSVSEPDINPVGMLGTWSISRSRMPEVMAILDQLQKSVLFIGTRERERFKPRATAFLCSWQDTAGFRFMYLVTAEHVISGLLTKGWDLWGSVNMLNGDVAEFALPHDVFCFHPDEMHRTDVAVCPLSDFMRAQGTGETVTMDVMTIALNGPKSIALTPEISNDLQIGLGDQVGIIGLFRSHYGKERIIPIARMGNIACMRNEPVFTEYAGYIDAYLIEAHSIGGLSGSPVFLMADGLRGIKSPDNPERVTFSLQHGKPAFYLIGLVHGHFDIKNLNEDTVVENERATTAGINTGVGIVVPVDKIIETVRDHPDLEAKRQQTIQNLKKDQRAGTVDLANVPDASDPVEGP